MSCGYKFETELLTRHELGVELGAMVINSMQMECPGLASHQSHAWNDMVQIDYARFSVSCPGHRKVSSVNTTTTKGDCFFHRRLSILNQFI